MTTYGTSHFLSLGAAFRYYRDYGETPAQVNRKIAEGLIHIGRPSCKPGERVVILPSEGRYAITTTKAEA